MTDMSDAEPQPEDVEIYVKRVELKDILNWLASHFDIKAETRKGEILEVTLAAGNIEFACKIFEKAARGGYTSIWFTENHTPWEDDLSCAREAFRTFAAETRCINGNWDGNEEDSGGWIRITADGEAVVNWRT